MTPKEAVQRAKDYVGDLFAADGARNIGLEELRFEPNASRWIVTIGLSRPWEGEAPRATGWAASEPPGPRPRTFKVVEIADADGAVIDLRHWSEAA